MSMFTGRRITSLADLTTCLLLALQTIQLWINPLPKVSIAAHTDLRSLYNFLVKLGTTKEKHRMIDIMTLREAYGHNDLMDIRWIDSRDNLVDAITKARWVCRNWDKDD
ncbi:hypothetical protein P3342_001718 [Pyrenophora teres f. teres]|nr:hypothetical protein P3342_001718 [Pyrenophora teres f. teres]